MGTGKQAEWINVFKTKVKGMRRRCRFGGMWAIGDGRKNLSDLLPVHLCINHL